MSTTTLKKAHGAGGSPAVAKLFEELTVLFASTPARQTLRLAPKQLEDSFAALEKAPGEELAVLHTVLREMFHHVERLIENGAPSEEAREAEKQDAQVQRILAAARGRPAVTEQTAEQAAEAAAFMAEMRQGSAAALQRRIESKELLPPVAFQDAVKMRRQSISDAVKAGRMFALVGPSGENYYPAFYGDGEQDRRRLEKVSKALGQIPAASKYFFFTTPSTFLGGMTPLDALKKGRVSDVLAAATGFAEG